MMAQHRSQLPLSLIFLFFHVLIPILTQAAPTNYDYANLPDPQEQTSSQNLPDSPFPNRDAEEAPQFPLGQPIDGAGKGAPILGGTNQPLDVQNPSNLGQQATDNGVVPNLKWSFSQSKTRLANGGWSREQVIQDLPQSHDVAAAQQHLRRGAIRELHWHRTAEWGFV